jgi:hypothetical protein
MSYLKPNLSGVYDIPSLNASSQLYIRGKKFEDYINELVFEDQLEQGEIDEIKLLLQYLNTSGLSSEWIVDNNNKNQDLKTAITALQTKLANITTTSLTQNSNLTDDNRNSVLKTRTDTLDASMNALTGRVDGNDSSIGTLNGKTQYITSSVGDNNANPKTYSQHAVVVSNAAQRKRILLSPYPSLQGAFNINLTNDESQGLSVGTDAWAAINRIDITNQNGNIEIEARKTHILGKIELGEFSDTLVNRQPINIGGSMARINIGSEKTPKTGTGPGDPDTNDSTIITVGKLGTLKNTWTYLNGNIYTNDGRFTSLSVTDVITWGTAASWFAGFVFSGVPYWLAWIGLSGTPNYRYSDVVKMANNYLTNGLTKNGKIETSNDLALKALTIVNTDLVSLSTPFDGLLNRLVLQAFAIHGSHSIGTIWGKVNMYCGSGEIELRNDGSVFDWAFKGAGNSNQLLIKNMDVELVQCNHTGTNGAGRLKLVAGNGNIDFETANNGVRSNTTKVMEIKANKQIVIGSNSNIVDDSYKMIIDATSHTNGVFIRKGNDTLLLNPTNVSSKSLTLQSGYAGTTINSLYLSEGGQLMFNGSIVGSGTGGDSGAGGIIYLLSGPASDITYTAANLFPITYAMTSTYVSRATTRIRFGNYNAGSDYNLFNHRGPIPRASSNPILKGSYEMNPYITYTGGGGAAASWYANAFFYADSLGTLSPFEDFLINKFYPLSLQGGTSFQYVGSVGTTAFIPTNGNAFVLNIRQVRFPFINIFGSNLNFRCEIVDTDNQIVLYTFPILVLTSQGGGTITSQVDMTFDAGSVIKVDQGFIWIGTRFRFRFTLVSGSSGCFFSQQTAFNLANMSFNIPHFTGVNFTTQLSINSANRATLVNSPTQTLSSLTLPITDYDISIFSNPQLDLQFWFRQPSGSTSNHTIDVHFWDGALSHVHTSINTAAAAIPGLAAVMNNGNSASATLNMNSNVITNIPFGGLSGTDGVSWNVKNISAGGGITATNNGAGTVTIATTNNVVNVGLRYGGPLTGLVNFNMAQSYSLTTHRVVGRAQLFVNNLFDYPVIRISGVGDVASAANRDEQAYSWHTFYQNPAQNSENLHNTATNNNWLDRSCCFSNVNLPNACEVLLEFTINLIRDPQGANGGNNSVIRGRATWISKVVNTLPAFKMYGLFERHTAATTFGSITLGSYGGFDQSVTHANLNVDIIPLPTF